MAEDSGKNRQKTNPHGGDVEAAVRKTTDKSSTGKSRSAGSQTSTKQKAATAAAQSASRSMDKKAEDGQVEKAASVSQTLSPNPTGSAPAPTSASKPPQSKEGRNVHPLALWVPLVVVGAFVGFMRTQEQAPSPQDATAITAQPTSGANDAAVVSLVDEKTRSKPAIESDTADSQPEQRAGGQLEPPHHSERPVTEAGGKIQPQRAEASGGASELPPTPLPQSTPVAAGPEVQSGGEPAAMEAGDRAASGESDDRQKIVTRPASSPSSVPSTPSGPPIKTSKAASSPKEETASGHDAAGSADRRGASTRAVKQHAPSGQTPADAAGSTASKSRTTQSTAPTPGTIPSGPSVSWWAPTVSPPNIYPARPYAYPPAFAGQSFRPYGPPNVAPYGEPAYPNWRGW